MDQSRGKHMLHELADLARSVVNDPTASRLTQVSAAYAMVLCGQPDGMTELMMNAANSSDITDNEFVLAAEFLLEHHGRQHARHIMDLIEGHRRTSLFLLGDLATAMSQAGAHTELAELARSVLAHPEVDIHSDLTEGVIRAWGLSAVRNGGGREIADTILSTRHIDSWTRVSSARELHRAGLSGEAASVIKHLVPALTRECGDSVRLQWALETLLEVDQAKHLAYVAEYANDIMLVEMQTLIDGLIKAGDADTVVNAARRLLADPVAPQDRRLAAVEAWLRADNTAATATLSIVRNLRPSPAERLGHAKRMRLGGAAREARTLALDVLADPVASKDHMLAAVKVFLRTGGRDKTATAIATLRANRTAQRTSGHRSRQKCVRWTQVSRRETSG